MRITNQQRRKILYIFGGIAVIAALACGAWYTAVRNSATNSSAAAFGTFGSATPGSTQQADSGSPQAAPKDCGQTAGDTCALYQNSIFGFSIYHPAKQNIETYDEGGGAQTITFQDVRDGSGFQVYALPYSGTQISQARFAMDEPSGVRDDVRNAIVGGAPGVAFYSKNAMLGDTYEVWFIDSDRLYEVTTLKPLEQELNAVLATWRFR